MKDGKTMRQQDLADAVGVSEGLVSSWENERYPPSLDQLRKIAKATGRPVSDFLEESPSIGETIPLPRAVPLVSWIQAGEWCEVTDLYEPGVAEKFFPIPVSVAGPQTYALRVQGDSMAPKFLEGDIIVVDPEKEAQNGSNVVVRLDDSMEATFKQLVIEGGQQYLKPLNPRYPIIAVDQNATICGVVVYRLTEFQV